MLDSLPDFMSQYWMYLAGVAVFCAALSFYSETILGYMKKALIIIGAVFLVIAGYELFTGESIFTMPGSVDKKLSEKVTNPETGRRYYKDYEERYGDDPTEMK